MAHIGARIREQRLRYGMSQAELARRIHISQTALNHLERGQTQDPRFSIVENIASVLGVTIDHLVRDEPAPDAPHQGAEKTAAAVAVL